MLPSAERFCHASSPNGFHCHWYFSGCAPVASTENVTSFPERMLFWLTGWDVTLGGLAARINENDSSLLCTVHHCKKLEEP